MRSSAGAWQHAAKSVSRVEEELSLNTHILGARTAVPPASPHFVGVAEGQAGPSQSLGTSLSVTGTSVSGPPLDRPSLAAGTGSAATASRLGDRRQMDPVRRSSGSSAGGSRSPLLINGHRLTRPEHGVSPGADNRGPVAGFNVAAKPRSRSPSREKGSGGVGDFDASEFLTVRPALLREESVLLWPGRAAPQAAVRQLHFTASELSLATANTVWSPTPPNATSTPPRRGSSPAAGAVWYGMTPNATSSPIPQGRPRETSPTPSPPSLNATLSPQLGFSREELRTASPPQGQQPWQPSRPWLPASRSPPPSPPMPLAGRPRSPQRAASPASRWGHTALGEPRSASPPRGSSQETLRSASPSQPARSPGATLSSWRHKGVQQPWLPFSNSPPPSPPFPLPGRPRSPQRHVAPSASSGRSAAELQALIRACAGAQRLDDSLGQSDIIARPGGLPVLPAALGAQRLDDSLGQSDNIARPGGLPVLPAAASAMTASLDASMEPGVPSGVQLGSATQAAFAASQIHGLAALALLSDARQRVTTAPDATTEAAEHREPLPHAVAQEPLPHAMAQDPTGFSRGFGIPGVASVVSAVPGEATQPIEDVQDVSRSFDVSAESPQVEGATSSGGALGFSDQPGELSVSVSLPGEGSPSSTLLPIVQHPLSETSAQELHEEDRDLQSAVQEPAGDALLIARLLEEPGGLNVSISMPGEGSLSSAVLQVLQRPCSETSTTDLHGEDSDVQSAVHEPAGQTTMARSGEVLDVTATDTALQVESSKGWVPLVVVDSAGVPHVLLGIDGDADDGSRSVGQDSEARRDDGLLAALSPSGGGRAAVASACSGEGVSIVNASDVILQELQAGEEVLQQLADIERRGRAPGLDGLGEAQWSVLKGVFERCLPGGVREVATPLLLSELKDDARVGTFLDDIIGVADVEGANAPLTTLRQALEYVRQQPLPTVSWEAFRGLVCEAPRLRRGTLAELLLAAEGTVAAFDLDQRPARASAWFADAFCVNLAVLERIYSRFVNCQSRSSPFAGVPRGTFVRSIKSCQTLLLDMHRTPLRASDAPPPRRLRSWVDVLVDLECHEYDLLLWSHVLEVVRWNREIELGLAPLPSQGVSERSAARGRLGPSLHTAASRENLLRMLGGNGGSIAAAAAGPAAGSAVGPAAQPPAAPSKPLPQLSQAVAAAAASADRMDRGAAMAIKLAQPEKDGNSRADQVTQLFDRGLQGGDLSALAVPPVLPTPSTPPKPQRVTLRVRLPGLTQLVGSSDVTDTQALEEMLCWEAAKILGLPRVGVKLAAGGDRG